MRTDPAFLTPTQLDEWRRMALAEADEDQRSHADLVVGKLIGHIDAADREISEQRGVIRDAMEFVERNAIDHDDLAAYEVLRRMQEATDD